MPRKDKAARLAYQRQLHAETSRRKRSARFHQRQARIEARSKHDAVSCAWAAGHFEGEGTVTITRSGDHTRALVSLSSTDAAAIDFFDSRWHGMRRSFTPKSISGNVRMAHTWCLNSGEKIECFLLDILPFVMTERVRQKIHVVLEDIRDRALNPQQPGTRERSETRRAAVSRMNTKGRDSNIPLLAGPK